MDCVKRYFDFQLVSLCGIPQVALEGTIDDWQLLLKKTESLGERYGLTWWTWRLLPILERIAKNAAGQDDAKLWQTIYKMIDGSGGPYISGWISDFFPYVGHEETNQRNPSLAQERRSALDNCPLEDEEFAPWECCITCDMLPGSLSQVPFKWKYLTEEYDMQLLAGFVGYTQDHDSLQIRPKIGWAVRETTQLRAD